MINWLKLYYFLPYPFKVLSASMHGYYLRWWRYGSDTDRLVEEILERETWNVESWRAWQEEKIASVLKRARFKVPYYREYWDERKRKGEKSSWKDLENWPVLKKEVLRSKPRAFIADDCNPEKMYKYHTSGSTGKPLNLWASRKTLQYWYALFEARGRRWNGVSQHDRWAILGGQLIVPYEQELPPFWVWNRGLNQLYLSSYHLTPRFIPSYIEAMHRYKIQYVWGYASSLYSLARFSLELGLELPSVKVVVSYAEPLYDFQREVIEKVFKTSARNTYAMNEMVGGGSECQSGVMHWWPDAGVLEVLSFDSDTTVSPGQIGRFVCTGFVNTDMLLIRYEVGDSGKFNNPGQSCRCGRSLPILTSIEGRLDDVLLTHDGRRIGRLDLIFKADLPIREAQIVQENLNKLCVRVTPASNYQSEDGKLLIERIRNRVGKMEIKLELVDNIPRGPNGKFRGVICKINKGA